jgi:hypothetical protein
MPSACVFFLSARPKALGSGNHARPKHGCQTQDIFAWPRRGPIDHRRQPNHYLFTCATPCERGHRCTFSEMTDDQIWPPRSVTHLSLMARMLPFYQGRKRKSKKCFVRRWKIKSETTIIIHNKKSLFTIKNLWIYIDFFTPFNFGYNEAT